MLVLLRIGLGAALLYAVKLAYENAQSNAVASAFDGLIYVAVVLVLAILNGVVWAPFLGGRVADALTGGEAGAMSREEWERSLSPARRLLRRILRWTGWAMLLALVGLLYHYRALFEPAADVYRAWRMGQVPMTAPEREFTVVRVLPDGENLQGRDSEGRIFTIRLAGVAVPREGRTGEDARATQAFLSSQVLSNTVQVEVTLTNQSRVLLGVVRSGSTNLNAAVIASGHAELRPEYLGRASLRSRVDLLAAQRRAERR